MTRVDPFEDLARFYDGLMETVDYDRWLLVAMSLADLAPTDPFTHLDIACGTGLLSRRLRQHGWPTIGVDLSPSMLRVGQRAPYAPPMAQADMTALPFRNAFAYITCLFDSVNFLLDEDAVRETFRSVRAALRDDGVFYFDVITERMVVDHFEGKSWTEKNRRFRSSWESTYDRTTGIADTIVRINRQPHALIRERVYTLDTIEAALAQADLQVLGTFDAETWKPPSKKSVRVEFVVAPQTSPQRQRKLTRAAQSIRGLLQG